LLAGFGGRKLIDFVGFFIIFFLPLVSLVVARECLLFVHCKDIIFFFI
jgi:hypothetical protein